MAYRISDGLRHVVPYEHVYSLRTKQRWLGRDLLGCFSADFRGSFSERYLAAAIRQGVIRVNGKRAEVCSAATAAHAWCPGA